MTVIQTVAGGAGGSGQVIDATGSIYRVTGTSNSNAQCVVYLEQKDSIGYPEISIDGKILKTYGCLPQSRPSYSGKYVTSALIADVKSGLENLLPDLSDGTYIIITSGCGKAANYATMPYWTLTVSGGVYSLSYSGEYIMFYHSSYTDIRLISISKIS